ncbi:MAG: hypothetical protein NAOJABEB_00639 [Steroidobacteraceae bacterium]|nr:hypothetical protein [Steroidobacteraceae bacterium]
MLAGARAEVEQAVGLEHDLRIVLDDHERVAGIPQPVHHLDHAPHVARVQPDRRLVEHEQRVDERGAERGGQIDALDLAARERARLAVEREVAEPHVDEVGEARADLAEELRGRDSERLGQGECVEEPARALERQQREVVDAQARQRRELRCAPRHAARQEARPRAECRVGERAAAESRQERRPLQPRTPAGLARRVGAILREHHAHVHAVGAALEPFEEALRPVPHFLAPRALTLDHPLAVGDREVLPGRVERNAAQLRVLLEILLAFAVRGGLKRLDGAAAQRFRFIRYHEAIVDADHAAESPAGVARTDRRVERERARREFPVGDVAARTRKVARVVPGLRAVHRDAAGSVAQRRLEAVDDARAFRFAHPEPVLHDLERRIRTHAVPQSRVTLAREQFAHFRLREIPRYRDRKRELEPRIAGRSRAPREVRVDRVGCVAPHGLGAALTVECGGAGKEQLQVIVQLGHRADGRAGTAHRVRLVDRDRGRNALDAVDLRLVHAVEELPRIGRERFDVAPLAFGIQRVEDERGLPRAGNAGHDDEFPERDLEVEVLQVVLARAADGDGADGMLRHG